MSIYLFIYGVIGAELVYLIDVIHREYHVVIETLDEKDFFLLFKRQYPYVALIYLIYKS